MEIKPQIKILLDELNEGVYEKQEVTALTLLTAIAGESIFLLGAPGVAKSLVARRLKFAFKGGSSFEYLMNRFSTPDEIFGPVSISKLKDEDKYERIVKNYLPSATVVFLDEIWKAGPSIQNALLTVLNEKIYRNGDMEIHVPMKALIAASNELPMKGEGLEALWDRFLVRYMVGGIEDKKNFNDMISKTLKSYDDTISTENKLTDEQYIGISTEIDKVLISENIFNVIHIIRARIDTHNSLAENVENIIYISDRRWRKIVRLLRTSAFLNDRAAVDMMDCFLITHCIWHEAEQYKTVLEIVKDTIKKHGFILDMNLKDIQDELGEFDEDVIEGCKFYKQIGFMEPELFYKKFYKILKFSFNVSFNGTYNLIPKSDFKKLKTENALIGISCDSENSASMEKPKKYVFSKGKEVDTLNHEGVEYKIQYIDRERTETFTMPPPPLIKEKFINRLDVILKTTAGLKHEIEDYRKNDLVNLKNNLFVNPIYAELLETNLNNTRIEIEKLEVEAKRIQHFWENIEDQSGLDFSQIA